MSAPVAAQQVQQVQQQQQNVQQPKKGESKFDGMMADKAQQANPANQANHVNGAAQAAKAQQVNQTQSTQATQRATHTAQARRPESIRHGDPVSARAPANRVEAPAQTSQAASVAHTEGATKAGGGQMMGLLGDIEKGQGLMDKLINGGLSGKSFSNSELLALQAGMYKYTQELELTGKVVEKATTGLKDTLKTQV